MGDHELVDATEDERVGLLLRLINRLSDEGRAKILRSLAAQATEVEVFTLLPPLLARVKDWRFVPHDVFEALLRIRPYPALEMVLIAMDPDERDAWVYMTKRPDNDQHYAGLLHVPGSIMRLGDRISDIVERLQKNELGFSIPELLAFVDLHENKDKRGDCLGLIYMGDVGMLPENRTNWYRVRDIDHTQLCLHHGGLRGIVSKAVEDWRMGTPGDYMVLKT